MPIRTCIGCRNKFEQSNLIRYIKLDNTFDVLSGFNKWKIEAIKEILENYGIMYQVKFKKVNNFLQYNREVYIYVQGNKSSIEKFTNKFIMYKEIETCTQLLEIRRLK